MVRMDAASNCGNALVDSRCIYAFQYASGLELELQSIGCCGQCTDAVA